MASAANPRDAIWGALTILRLLYAQQQARGAGGYAKVVKDDIERLEAAYAALQDAASAARGYHIRNIVSGLLVPTSWRKGSPPLVVKNQREAEEHLARLGTGWTNYRLEAVDADA